MTQPDPYQDWTDRLALLLGKLDAAIQTAREQQTPPLQPARPDATSPHGEWLPAETPGDRACTVFLELQDGVTDALVAATNNLRWLRIAVDTSIDERMKSLTPAERKAYTR